MNTRDMGTNFKQARPRCVAPPPGRAFTLIEMLVVLAIIGILSALIIAAVSQTGPKKAISVTKAKRAELITHIENYKNDFGSYPPDNPNNPGTNTLFYELTGVIFTNNFVTPALATFTSPLVPTDNLTSAQMLAVFGIPGVQNVARTNFFGTPGIQNTARTNSRPKSYFGTIRETRDYSPVTVSGISVMLLTPPPQAQKDLNLIITWRYDASSSRRRNMNGFDLWADLPLTGKTNTISYGNW